jgi:hypothetical protein
MDKILHGSNYDFYFDGIKYTFRVETYGLTYANIRVFKHKKKDINFLLFKKEIKLTEEITIEGDDTFKKSDYYDKYFILNRVTSRVKTHNQVLKIKEASSFSLGELSDDKAKIRNNKLDDLLGKMK